MSDQSSFVEQVAHTIRHRQLERLALTLLEIGRPFTFLGGQLLWLAQPSLGLMMPRELVSQLAMLLEEPEALDQLRQQLETADV